MNAFLSALLDPASPVPAGLVDGAGRPAGRRFDVYRNNVAVSLTEALEAAFPVIEKLVGAEFFRAMAGVFLRAHPPKSPVLALWGDDFPAFLEQFGPVAHLPYLADVARLEQALREAYHAADAAPIDPAALDRPDLAETCLRLAPATRLICSQWPIHAIWRANTEEGAPPARGGAECVLVVRPDWDPWPRPVSPAAARFLEAVGEGRSLAEAIEAGGPEHDLAATLSLLIATKSIVAI
ncbi:MAG: DUF2063 domain-containing protein, partial [Alphaproteobacteria bacterium]